MPSINQFVTFLVASILFIQVPGPSLLFTIGRALTVGRREALLSIVGNSLGLFAQIVGIAIGLGTVIAASATAFTALKMAGAAYVVWLGIQAIRHRGDARLAMTVGNPVVRGKGHVRLGFFVGVTNPKTVVFFVAFLPQFINAHAPAAPQMLGLGLVFSVMAIASDSVWAAMASRARDWFARKPERLDALSAGGGLMMIGLGATLVTASAD